MVRERERQSQSERSWDENGESVSFKVSGTSRDFSSFPLSLCGLRQITFLIKGWDGEYSKQWVVQASTITAVCQAPGWHHIPCSSGHASCNIVGHFWASLGQVQCAALRVPGQGLCVGSLHSSPLSAFLAHPCFTPRGSRLESQVTELQSSRKRGIREGTLPPGSWS